MAKQTKKKYKIKIRKPVPNKASRPMSTKKGKKGYQRKKKHKQKLVNKTEDFYGKCTVIDEVLDI